MTSGKNVRHRNVKISRIAPDIDDGKSKKKLKAESYRITALAVLLVLVLIAGLYYR